MSVRIYVSVDMEGITGVAVGKHVMPGEKDYERFRRLMTQDANAAVEGAMAAGATEAVVSDGHGPMTNVLIEELHPQARLISGSNRVLGQLDGIDQGFEAAFFVGYHQREGGGDGILNHTLIGRIVYEVRVNGEPADEAVINAGLAGAFNVPVALITGDTAVCADAQRRLPGVVTGTHLARAHGRPVPRCAAPRPADRRDHRRRLRARIQSILGNADRRHGGFRRAPVTSSSTVAHPSIRFTPSLAGRRFDPRTGIVRAISV